MGKESRHARPRWRHRLYLPVAAAAGLLFAFADRFGRFEGETQVWLFALTADDHGGWYYPELPGRDDEVMAWSLP